jgi:chromosome segregation ATPase
MVSTDEIERLNNIKKLRIELKHAVDRKAQIEANILSNEEDLKHNQTKREDWAKVIAEAENKDPAAWGNVLERYDVAIDRYQRALENQRKDVDTLQKNIALIQDELQQLQKTQEVYAMVSDPRLTANFFAAMEENAQGTTSSHTSTNHL